MSKSEAGHIKAGVLQGSVLGPILLDITHHLFFLLYRGILSNLLQYEFWNNSFMIDGNNVEGSLFINYISVLELTIINILFAY